MVMLPTSTAPAELERNQRKLVADLLREGIDRRSSEAMEHHLAGGASAPADYQATRYRRQQPYRAQLGLEGTPQDDLAPLVRSRQEAETMAYQLQNGRPVTGNAADVVAGQPGAFWSGRHWVGPLGDRLVQDEAHVARMQEERRNTSHDLFGTAEEREERARQRRIDQER